jgi:hypothetical protein
MTFTPGPAPVSLDRARLANRLEAIEDALARARADAFVLADEGLQAGELLYELDAARRGLRHAAELARELAD